MIRQSVQIVSGLHRIGRWFPDGNGATTVMAFTASPGSRIAGVTMIAPRRCNHFGSGATGCVIAIHCAPASPGNRTAGRKPPC
ncbi:hypothetical protein [Chloroflexus islandicus]|uniref:hypothetical protein n=1 Tax=Chloroflexus islandicus TaxID=1707952 RepID=UPI000AAFD3FF|nr:hypothetical protein [Chloroflexus islandicus]